MFSATIRTPAVCGPILLQFSEKSPHRLSKVSHFFDLSCAGKLWSSRIEWRAKRRNLTECGRSHHGWNVEVDQKLSLKSAKKLTKKHFILSTRLFQTWWDQLQKVKRRRLTRRWMRQDQSFPAQVELLLHDKPVRLWRLISENETKCSNFEQNVSTKCQKKIA